MVLEGMHAKNGISSKLSQSLPVDPTTSITSVLYSSEWYLEHNTWYYNTISGIILQ